MERYSCLQPEYVSKFQCDGSRCQSKCCRDWGVTLDPATLEKYRGIGDRPLREEILSHVRQEGEDLSIALRENGWCSFLREDYLCRLQRDLGEEYLSCTCRTFPRMVYIVGDFLERSLSMACPVAAELVLWDSAPMAFEQAEMVVDAPIVARRPQPSGYLGEILEIQQACISLLQDRRFAMDRRLALLGSFLEQVQAGQGDAVGMERLAGFYASDALEGPAGELFCAMRFCPDRCGELMEPLLREVYAREQGLSIEDAPLGAAVRMVEEHGFAEFLERVCLPAWETMLGKHGQVLENYLVNEFFLNIFPFRVQGSLLQNFCAFLLGCRMLGLVLAAQAKEQGGVMDERSLVELLMDFSRRMDHASVHMECIKGIALGREWSLASLWSSLLQA